MLPEGAALAAFLLLSFALVSSAGAADLTRLLLGYLTTKTPPTETSSMSKEVYVRVWGRPPILDTDGIMLISSENIGPQDWLMVVIGPKRPISDDLGSTTLTALGTVNQPERADVFRIESGRLRGFYVEDGFQSGRHMLSIVPPLRASRTPGVSPLIK